MIENVRRGTAVESDARFPCAAPTPSLLVSVFALAAGLAGSITPTRAQSKPVPGFADYGKWETLGAAGGGRRRRRRRPVERRQVARLRDQQVESRHRASAAESRDECAHDREVRHRCSCSARTRSGPRGRLATPKRNRSGCARSSVPIQNRLAIMNLATGEKTTVDAMQSFAFSGDGKFLLMRRYAPTPPGGAGAAAAAAPAPAGRGGRGGRGGRSAARRSGSDGHLGHGSQSRDRRGHDVRQRRRVRVAGHRRGARDDDQRGRARRQRRAALRRGHRVRCASSSRPPRSISGSPGAATPPIFS